MFAPVFSLAELLQMIGLAQCAAGAVFLWLQTPDKRLAGVPALYYLALGGHFAGLFLGAGPFADGGDDLLLLVALGVASVLPAATVLLALQVVLGHSPRGRTPLVLLAALPELALLGLAFQQAQTCLGDACVDWWQGFRLAHVIAAALLLLGLQLWLGRRLTEQLAGRPAGRERYWLVTALLGLLTLNLAIDFLNLAGMLDEPRAITVSTVIALTFVYLVVTLLFRLYPQGKAADPAAAEPEEEADDTPPARELTPEDQAVIERIRALLTLDKVYQDAEYGRDALARELGLPEHRLSALVKAGFGRGVRQLLNDHRVAEACQLLRDSDRPVGEIAFDAGFNSLPSFNRVFKATTGQSPSEFRAKA